MQHTANVGGTYTVVVTNSNGLFYNFRIFSYGTLLLTWRKQAYILSTVEYRVNTNKPE
jgi:hypothetical protein